MSKSNKVDDSPRVESIPIPEGLSLLLERAVQDESLRDKLYEDPERAAQVAGLALSDRERAVLKTISGKQMEAIMARLLALQVKRRRFLEQTAASAVTALGGAALSAFQVSCEQKPKRKSNAEGGTGGLHPDMPGPMKPWKPEPTVVKTIEPAKHPKPSCRMTLVIGDFRTISGPGRTPGEADRERLQDQLERICDAKGVSAPGKVVYEFTVDAAGAVKDLKSKENTVNPTDFDVLTRQQLERLVFFEAGEPSNLKVTIELK